MTGLEHDADIVQKETFAPILYVLKFKVRSIKIKGVLCKIMPSPCGPWDFQTTFPVQQS